MVTVLPTIAARIQELESKVSTFEPMDHATQLEALVPRDSTLTDDERRGCLAEIVAWRFQPIRGEDRQPWGTYFGPVFTGMTEDGQLSCNPDIRWIPPEVIDYWIGRSAASPHPLIQARFADLAWELLTYWNREHPDRRRERPRNLAQRAIDAYLEVIDDGLAGEVHHAWVYLGRALELSLFIQDKQRVEKATQAAFAFARSRQADARSGHWWNLHSLVWDVRGLSLTDAEREELISWLEAALAVHSNSGRKDDFNPHSASDAAEMLRLWRRKAGQPDEAIRAVRQAAAAFEAIAEEADALTAIAWLEDVSAKYRRDDLMDDAARVDARIMKRSGDAENALVRHEVRYEVPAEQMEGWLTELMSTSLPIALGRIAVAFVRPEASLQRLIEQMVTQAPLQAHMPISIMGPHGFTIAKIGSVADDLPGRMIHMASQLIGQQSPWLNWALERAKTDWQLNASNLFDWLVQSAIFTKLGHSLLRLGLEAWQVGDAAKAIHLLVPQVESAVRELMTSLGESPMKLDTRSGGFESKGLGEMLVAKSIREFLDPSFLHQLRSLYTHPKGLNLRNRIAHGLAGEEMVGRGMANWVVHSLIGLRVYASNAAAQSVKASKADKEGNA